MPTDLFQFIPEIYVKYHTRSVNIVNNERK